MAAYAALVSLMQIIKQLQQHHPRPPISLDKTQFESLTKHVTFLQQFLESNIINSHHHRALETRIANAAHAAEDVIESLVVDQILATAESTSSSRGEEISSVDDDFYQGLQKVIGDLDLIEKEVIQIMIIQDDHQLLRSPSMPTGSSSSRSPPASEYQSITVGLDDVLIEFMDKLTCHHRSAREIIPIVGMGGIGKTTLARNIYVNPFIVHHFDVLAWVTISQNYSIKEILLEVLSVLSGGNKEMREMWSRMNDQELGVELHKKLSRRRYLIIMDDVWSIEVWDKINFFFPDNGNGSRIVITTRLSNLAFELTHSHGHKMSFLNDVEGWDLFCKIVFGGDDCPTRELEEVGKKIVENCKGLPLSISVIGGLLAKSTPTQKYWEYIAENLNSIVTLEDDERCLKILQTSYDNLPVHLKPCFLYMGVYPEDTEIKVFDLINLWVAEGFLKPISGKSLEVVAKEYIKDLIDRNLILVGKRGRTGNIKICKIHDVLRDLSSREAEKERFFHVAKTHHGINIPQGINTQRRIVFHQSSTSEEYHLSSASLTRSLIHNSDTVPGLNFRLLRVRHPLRYSEEDRHSCSLEDILKAHVNLRYLAIKGNVEDFSRLPSSVHLLWNLHTLFVDNGWVTVTAPSEIWTMPQLRHVILARLCLPDPPVVSHMDRGDDFVLGNLQTLYEMCAFRCSEEVVKRIPNIKKLGISYHGSPSEGWSVYCLNNLSHLHKLESLRFDLWGGGVPNRADFTRNITFPHSLKKLTLYGTGLHWEDMSTMIGSSLRRLEVLKIDFSGPVWETVEDQFCSLKSLQISFCKDLECWMTDSTHFPRLEHLLLHAADKLKEIPCCIGDIPTLQSIQLDYCCDSIIISAKEMLEEQEECGEVGLQVRAHLRKGHSELQESFSGELANFHLYFH